MDIRRLSLLKGATKATGTTVIIDVFRAFTTAAYVMANGAEKIIPVIDIDDAFKMKKIHPKWILMGESHGIQIPGFDYGNSPADIETVDFRNKTVIQRTSSGTQGISLAKNADEILLGSFVMAEAISNYIKRKNPKIVSLVAMGWEGAYEAPEDELLAVYLENRLHNVTLNFEEMVIKIRNCSGGMKFFDRTQENFKERDFHLAMTLNRFNFALRVEKQNPPFYIKV
jgi:2-phosphosulfolactate phosphatase